MIELCLYTGPHCKLCDDALELIWPQLDSSRFKLEEVDVTASLELKKQYGLRIPVLQRTDTNTELLWPFDADALARFLI